MTYKQLTQYPNHWQRDRELKYVDGIWRDERDRIWMPYHPEESDLEFLYINHTPRHVMVRYVGRHFDEDAPPGDRWVKYYDVICLDERDEEGRIEILMLNNRLHEIDIVDGDWHHMPIGLNGRNITPKNEKEYESILRFLEHEFMAEVYIYRRAKDYHDTGSRS